MAPDSIYDHPEYYDVLFGWDRSKEVDFYHRTLVRCGIDVGERVVEIACGTGRVARLLARRGWRLSGLDVSPAMLAFLHRQAAAEPVTVETLQADMTSFSAPERFAAAYNPMSSFRLLHEDADVHAHLERTAEALRPGGVYVLDLDFVFSAGEEAVTTDEPWEMTRGGITVRADNEGIRVDDHGVELHLVWGREAHLRAYTVADFHARIAAIEDLEIESWHPERSRATGVSEFPTAPSRDAPRGGRAMVVLRRR